MIVWCEMRMKARSRSSAKIVPKVSSEAKIPSILRQVVLFRCGISQIEYLKVFREAVLSPGTNWHSGSGGESEVA